MRDPNPFTVGDEVWFTPQVSGYGYDYGFEPRGIPATVLRAFETRCTIQFTAKDTGTLLHRVVAVNNLCPRRNRAEASARPTPEPGAREAQHDCEWKDAIIDACVEEAAKLHERIRELEALLAAPGAPATETKERP